jgi:hypothetical protein
MITLAEWLQKTGFSGNPFAHKQADEEGDDLASYFVEHPAYNAILDGAQPHTTILHAPRGAGKSSTRRMFERHCQSITPPVLLVPLLDWMPLAHEAHPQQVIAVQHHLQALARQIVAALAASAERPQQIASHQREYLRWLGITYASSLPMALQLRLEQAGWLGQPPPDVRYNLSQVPPTEQLALFVELIRAIGYAHCYVLIDGIDELFDTAADWEAGANVIESLVSNLRLMEVPGMAFKFFVPSEIVTVLIERRRLRTDRLRIYKMDWDAELLQELLANRLAVFSGQVIHSLDQLAVPDLRGELDHLLVQAANGSPRELLNLGERLLQACARTADDTNLLIHARHLDSIVPQSPRRSVSSSSANPAIPLLRITLDGKIYRGDELCIGWDRVPPMQRRLLNYLYAQRHRLCSRDELIAHVWQDREKPADDDSLRKLLGRLIQVIEPDPDNLRYIQMVPRYIQLINTAEGAE